MAKKDSKQLANPKAKKSSKVETPARKPLEVAPPGRKPSEVAPTQHQPLKNPPPESSDDEEEVQTKEEEETDSSSEEEEEPKDSGKNPETPSASAHIVAATANQSSDAESESESESESDSEPERGSTKPPLPPPAASVSPLRKTKRSDEVAASSADVHASKRVKTETEMDTTKKALFQRIWTEEEEILLLQGILDFKTDTGKIPSCETMNRFYQTVQESINLENKTFSQFTKKISSLRTKYVGKIKSKGGVEPYFTKAHDHKCFEVAKKIWVSDNDSAVVKTKKKVKVKAESSEEVGSWFYNSFLVGVFTSLGVMDEATVKERWTMAPAKKKKKIEEIWKQLRSNESNSFLLKTDLIHAAGSVIVQAD